MKTTTRRVIIMVIMLNLFGTQTSIADDKTLSLVTTAGPPLGSTPEYTGMLEKISIEAFRRIGYQIKVTTLPGERALINVNSGIDDGDLFRAPGFESNYPNMLRVPEKIGILEFMAYSNTKTFSDFNWEALKPHTVAYASGWKIYDRKVKAAEITKVRNIRDLIPLLNNGRADIILIDRWQGQYIAKQSSMPIQPIEPPLATIDMYMYLNKKHQGLIPALTQALKSMKADGSYAEFYKRMQKDLQ